MIRPQLRLAKNEDADYIREILDFNDQIPDGHDWTDVGKNWIVAEYDSSIIGAVQVLCGKPFGHIGFLAVHPSYYNGGAGAILWRAAERVLANNGCDGYTAMTANEQILKKLPKIGGIVFGDPVSVVFKRVYREKK